MAQFGGPLFGLTGWQRRLGEAQLERERKAKKERELEHQRQMELVNPPPPELPSEAAIGMQRLVESYNQAYGAARQANEARYQQMLRIARGETARQAGVQQRMLGAVGQETGQRAADIRAAGASREADIMQQLARQGMAGTTVAPTMRAGVGRETSAELNRLSDLMLQRKLGVMGQMAAPRRGTELGIMERRTDAYPNLGALTSAFGAVGEGYGGPGMSAMFSALSKIRQ